MTFEKKKHAAVSAVMRCLRSNALAALALSVLLLVPCFWHQHIQAGDLGSHVYNAWLAQLSERHEITGVVVVRQWTNVLFDLLLLHMANMFGFIASEKLAVAVVVLAFFWGAFAFIAVLSGRASWSLTPFLLMLSYGYAFEMGFMNYCLSLGLAFFAFAAALSQRRRKWVMTMGLAGLALVAHPIGFVVFVALTAYVIVWKALPRWPRLFLPLSGIGLFVLSRSYFRARAGILPSWRSEGILQLLGQDQLNVYGHKYFVLSGVALAFAALMFGAGLYDYVMRGRKPARAFWVSAELYLVAVVATICLPENFRTGIYAGWVGLLVSRLTMLTAVLGAAILASMRLPRWSCRVAAGIAMVYFAFLYHDTGKLDRMETNARKLAKGLAFGTRIVAVANAPEDWRVPFIYHSIDRACIGHCFSFANYEASSLQFRVRAVPGNSAVVTASIDQSDDMSSGDYVVRQSDPPLISIYQCDDADFTQLCALPLRPGQKTEDPESEPGSIPEDDAE